MATIDNHTGEGHAVLKREIAGAPGRYLYECTCGASWIGD